MFVHPSVRPSRNVRHNRWKHSDSLGWRWSQPLKTFRQPWLALITAAENIQTALVGVDHNRWKHSDGLGWRWSQPLKTFRQPWLALITTAENIQTVLVGVDHNRWKHSDSLGWRWSQQLKTFGQMHVGKVLANFHDCTANKLLDLEAPIFTHMQADKVLAPAKLHLDLHFKGQWFE